MKKLDEEFWLKYFKVYDLLNKLKPYNDTLEEISKNIHGKGLSVLDVGCGTGNLIYRILETKNLVRAVGIDYSKAALSIAESKNKKKKASFDYGNLLDKLPYESDVFDVVVMNNVLYTIDINKRLFLVKEIYRVIKPGGKFILSNINRNFKPISIYISHVKYSLKERGVINTIMEIISFIKPTILIFYYNYLISNEEKRGNYSFIDKNEQKSLLIKAGFKKVSNDKLVYSSNAYLNIGIK